MRTVGLFEAKTHLSAIADAAARGETTILTKNGRPIAKVVPIQDNAERTAAQAEAVKSILARKIHVGVPMKELVERGRRH